MRRRLHWPDPLDRSSAALALVELVVCLVVLAALAGVILPRLDGDGLDDHDRRRRSDLIAIEQALRLYFLDHGHYPIVLSWSGEAPNYGGHGHDESGYIPGLVPEYLPALPSDPAPDRPAGSCGYLYRSNGDDFKLLAHRTPGSFPTDHRFFDPRRPTWAWQVSSERGAQW